MVFPKNFINIFTEDQIIFQIKKLGTLKIAISVDFNNLTQLNLKMTSCTDFFFSFTIF